MHHLCVFCYGIWRYLILSHTCFSPNPYFLNLFYLFKKSSSLCYSPSLLPQSFVLSLSSWAYFSLWRSFSWPRSACTTNLNSINFAQYCGTGKLESGIRHPSRSYCHLLSKSFLFSNRKSFQKMLASIPPCDASDVVPRRHPSSLCWATILLWSGASLN